ncbi:MAG: hypothetical protein NT010_01880 [Proteobacteria bacterium]|nr:hypothetical protein [Pseudomonadota bacterium]
MKNKKLTTFFIPNSHKRICEFGLSGQRHIENGSGVNGLQALQAVDVLNVRRRIAGRSRPPQMDIFRYAVDRPREQNGNMLKTENAGNIPRG